MRRIIFSAFLFLFMGLSMQSLLSGSLKGRGEIEYIDLLASGQIGPRSMVTIPDISATICDNLLTVYFDQVTGEHEVTILVTDFLGKTVYEETVVINQTVSIPVLLDIDTNNKYLLEIFSTDFYLRGWF